MMSDARIPIYQRLQDDFRRRIRDGEWQLDTALPSENELARDLGVAVGTIRKALDTLVVERVLERRQGRGTFLRRPTFDTSLFRFFRYEARNGERSVPKSTILSRDIEVATSEIAELLDLEIGATVIRLDRLRTIGSVTLLAEEIRLPQAAFAALVDLPYDRFGPLLYPLYEQMCGQVVASAKETLTVESATDADFQHLGLPAGAPVVAIERVALNAMGQPIEWRRSRGRGDRFRYRVDIR